MRKIILIPVLFLIVIPISFAIEDAGSYSTDNSSYLLWDRFNRANSGTVGTAETGQSWDETAGGAWEILNNNLYGVGGSTGKACVDLNPTQNFTMDTYFNVTGACAYCYNLRIFFYDASSCSGSTPFYASSGHPDFVFYNGTVYHFDVPVTSMNYLFRLVVDITNYKTNFTIYNVTNESGTITYTDTGSKSFSNWGNGDTAINSIQLFHDYNGGSGGANVDETVAWNWTDQSTALVRPTGAPSDTTPPEITFYNMTSEGGEGCTNWDTDKSNPCITNDTTPTTFFNTSESAYCAVGVSDLNYTDLGSSRNCTGGEGTMQHTCTLTTQDELTQENSYIYISCKDTSDNENTTSTSGALALKIHAKETGGAQAIYTGIQNALSAPYTTYPSQQISARDLNNNQFTGTFDWVAKKASKVWAFNYISSGESHVANTFNLTSVLYVLQLTNTTQTQVTLLVEEMINATK